MEEQQINPQLNIEISEEMSEGAYANLAIITHSHAEFVIDFISVMPNAPKSRVKSRIIFTPMHAKKIYESDGRKYSTFRSFACSNSRFRTNRNTNELWWTNCTSLNKRFSYRLVSFQSKYNYVRKLFINLVVGETPTTS